MKRVLHLNFELLDFIRANPGVQVGGALQVEKRDVFLGFITSITTISKLFEKLLKLMQAVLRFESKLFKCMKACRTSSLGNSCGLV